MGNKIKEMGTKAEKEYMKIVLFIVVLGTLLTIQINSAILLIGVAMLVYCTYRKFNLTKMEIMYWIVCPMILGLIAIILPHFFVLHTI